MEFVQDEDPNSPELTADTPSHGGSAAVTTVFLTVAFVVLVFGLAGAIGVGIYAHKHLGDSVDGSVGYGILVAVGVVFLASLLAFFGYVLQLLTEIANNTRAEIARVDRVPTAAEVLVPAEPAPAALTPPSPAT
jgi:uncharacterized membrane protein (DUF485 family)